MTYWTLDGRIFTKTRENGPKILIKSQQDIDNLPVYYQDENQDEDQDEDQNDEDTHWN